ncbi:DUF3883 domain-containing protein [Longimicrobium sp.]|uniref:DUF3883 domain-containing protein n=1 Tax=Longimicrobium sp. TaxID=2029185 RepID=UPI002E33C31B|nr:DUF3883 domain-containing protein [Longimicrobium sp.]HEX6040550.1 DUF3883 domain-containing protein [Longimicrobium sp.]
MNALTQRAARAAKSDWTPPAIPDADLRFNMGESVLVQFVAAHDPPGVLRELVQNEYDAGGRQLEVTFGPTSLRVKGTGATINTAGWKRLSLMLGTGRVHATGERVQEKVNGIGSKNFGLRSLFLFGDRIYVRSGGRQIFLDRLHGTPPVLPDPSSRGRPGVLIEVPYRTARDGLLQPFGADEERAAMDALAAELAPTLLKLARPGKRRSLETIVVRSERLGRRLAWKQSVEPLRNRVRGIQVLKRTIRLTDSERKRPQRFEEIEFQQGFDRGIHRNESFPEYFAWPGGKVLVGVSVRLRNEELDHAARGTFFYPLGVPQGFTGTAVSVNAPFQMDGDRTRLMDGSPWNTWLLNRAIELTTLLLRSDWLQRFGASAFHALAEVSPASPRTYLEGIAKHLKTEACWPSQKRESDGKTPVFVRASHLVIPDAVSLDGFIVDESRDLDRRLASDLALRKTAKDSGAMPFTLNSLVRLRCAGETAAGLHTKVEKQASFYYTNFPGALADAARQTQFARALDAHAKRLSPDNWKDLKSTPTTLTGANTLAPATSLWAVPQEFYELAEIPASDRLHPELVPAQVVGGLAKPFKINHWAHEVGARVRAGTANATEREALYRLLIGRGEELSRSVRAFLRDTPVLRDHAGTWMRPADLIPRTSAGADVLAPVLHFPHADFSRRKILAHAFRFRKRVEAADVIAFASTVATEPSRAPACENLIRSWYRKLPPQVLRQLRTIAWCRTSAGTILAPTGTYLDAPHNRACLGPDAQYVAAELPDRMLAALGCRSEPQWGDMVAYLGRLRTSSTHLDSPGVVYPALVDALRAERLRPESLAEQPVIWTGREWATPAETLVGSTQTRIFSSVVPLFRHAVPAVVQAVSALGASRTASARHWQAILHHVARTYPTAGAVVHRTDRDALRAAYAHLTGRLNTLPPDARVFMDRDGRLHTANDVAAHRYVIDDDPGMAAALATEETPIAFAAAEPATLPFLYDQGVASLRNARSLIRYRAGAEHTPHEWLDSEGTLNRMQDPVFASALSAYFSARSRRRGGRGEDQARALGQRLELLVGLKTVRELYAEYGIAGHTIQVPCRVGIEADHVLIAGARRKQEFMDLIARALADFLAAEHEDTFEIADPIYRLLACADAQEMRQYLNDRGVPWNPPMLGGDIESSPDEADEEDEEQGPTFPEPPDSSPDVPLQQVIGDILTRTLGEHRGRTPAQDSPAQPLSATTPAPPPRAHPPLALVEPILSQFTPGWRPAPTETRVPRSRGGGGWSVPLQSDVERDRALGRRGEEIVLEMERARVRAAGQNPDNVIWASESDEGADHDIRSVDDDGSPLWLEVKATSGAGGRFQWSRSEFELALRERSRYVLYRVYRADSAHPIVRPFRDPIGMMMEESIRLDIASLYAEVEPL